MIDPPDLPDLRVRTLIAPLAQIEDAISCVPTFATPNNGVAPLSRNHLTRQAREWDAVAELTRLVADMDTTRPANAFAQER